MSQSPKTEMKIEPEPISSLMDKTSGIGKQRAQAPIPFFKNQGQGLCDKFYKNSTLRNSVSNFKKSVN